VDAAPWTLCGDGDRFVVLLIVDSPMPKLSHAEIVVNEN
jgi:hypothetical protein